MIAAADFDPSLFGDVLGDLDKEIMNRFRSDKVSVFCVSTKRRCTE